MSEPKLGPLNLKSYPPGTQSELLSEVTAYFEDNLKTAINNAFVLHCTVTPTDLEQINKLVAPLIVVNPSPGRVNPGTDEAFPEFIPSYTPNDNRFLHTSTFHTPEHPVARCVASIGDFALRSRVSRVDPATVCEIGPAPASLHRARHHGCSVVTGRDTARIGAALATRPHNVPLRTALAGNPDPAWCTAGVENCMLQHHLGIASDSIYDITPKQMNLAMSNKGMTNVKATMWAPVQLNCPDGDYENELFHLKIHKGRATMDFLDSAFAYDHDLKNWRAWAFGSSYADPISESGIIWETIGSWGPFKMLSITRVYGSVSVIRPMPRNCQLVGVPNFTKCIDVILETKRKNILWWTKRKSHYHRRKIISRAVAAAPKIWLTRDLYSLLLQFILNRRDSDVDRPVVGSSVSAKASRMEVDTFILQAGFKLAGWEHRDLVLALMLIGTACRMMQSQIISKVLTLYKNGPEDYSLLKGYWIEFIGRTPSKFFADCISGNLGVVDAVAEVIGGDSFLVSLLANCVDEGHQREYSNATFDVMPPGKCLRKFTGRGGRGKILQCDCAGPVSKDTAWRAGNAWCVHGKPYAAPHSTIVAIEEVDLDDNYCRISPLDKSSSITEIFEEYSTGPVFNVCAAPGNDGNYGFARANYASHDLNRIQPREDWYLDGNVHCLECQSEMSQQYAGGKEQLFSNHYVDFSSPCPEAFFDPTVLGARWNSRNKYIVRVQNGLPMLKSRRCPVQYVGHYIVPSANNDNEVCIANFQGTEAWQEIRPAPYARDASVTASEDAFEAMEEPTPPPITVDCETQANIGAPIELGGLVTLKNGNLGVDAATQDEPEEVVEEGEEAVENTVSSGCQTMPLPEEEAFDQLKSVPTLADLARPHVEAMELRIKHAFNMEMDFFTSGQFPADRGDKPYQDEISEDGSFHSAIETEETEESTSGFTFTERIITPTPMRLSGSINTFTHHNTVQRMIREVSAELDELEPSAPIEGVPAPEIGAAPLEPEPEKYPNRVLETVAEEESEREVPPRDPPVIAHRCVDDFPNQAGCIDCLPDFKFEEHKAPIGRLWFNPQTKNECFASAFLAREATRDEIPLLTCIKSANEPQCLEAYHDRARYDFLSPRILQLLAIATKCKIVVEYYDQQTRHSYGEGHSVFLRLKDGHFTRHCNPCEECAHNDLFICNEVHDPQWEDVTVPAFGISQKERRVIRRELLNEKRYVEHHTPILQHLEAENNSFIIKMIVGVAGSGKTMTAMRLLELVEDLMVVVPTKKLMWEYRQKYSRPGLEVLTWSTYCRDPLRKSAVLIDEIFMQHPLVTAIAAANCDQLYGIGDPQQNDYGGRDTSRVIGHISSHINTGNVQLKCSRSVGLDVCRLVHKISNKQITLKTHNLTSKTLFPVISKKPREPVNGMCFENKEEVLDKWSTVTKMQGSRFKRGTLYLDRGFTQAVHQKPPRSVYVGLTRHTEHLDIICGTRPAFQIFESRHSCTQGGLLRTTMEGFSEFEHTRIEIAEHFSARKRMTKVTQELQGEHFSDTVKVYDVRGPTVTRRGNKMDISPEKVTGLDCTVTSDFTISNFIYNQWVLPSTTPFTEDNDVEDEEEVDDLIHSYIGYTGASFNDAEEVLEKISPTNSDAYEARRNLQFQYLGKNFSNKKLKIRIPDITSKQVRAEESMHLVTAARVRARKCTSSNYSQTVQTILGRYSKKVKLLKGKQARDAGDKLFEGLMKACPGGLERISDEEFASAQAAQVDRISAKKGDQEGILGTDYETLEKTDFFLKQQSKSDSKANSWVRGTDDGTTHALKAGQGISAQTKQVNHAVGAWVSATERKVKKALHPFIQLGYGRSVGGFRAKVRKLMKRNAKSDEVVCCDISEQDTSKGPWTNWFMRRVYRACGVPEDIIDLIEALNINWTIDARGCKLKVSHKFQSGRSDTLLANTLMNIGLILSSMDIEDLKFALFQGDDSYVRAGKVRLIDEHPNLKIERGPFGDFIGFLIGDDDIYLDLPRFAIKLMNRTFASDQEINDYRVAVYDWLRVFQTAEQLYKGVQFNAARYKVTEQDISVLVSFLRCFYQGKLINAFRSADHKCNPNAVITPLMDIVIGISDRKSGPKDMLK